MAPAYPTEEAAGAAVLDASPALAASRKHQREQDALERLTAEVVTATLRDADRVDHLAAGWGA